MIIIQVQRALIFNNISYLY